MSNCLDIDQILNEEERLPCKFLIDAPTLGHLDPTNAGYGFTLPEGSRVELPMWLATELSTKGMVDVEMPKHFGPKMREELQSSSDINVRDFSPYFFDVGLKLSKLSRDDDLVRTLKAALCGHRYTALLAHALSNFQDDAVDYMYKLTTVEQAIYRKGIETSKDLHVWRSRKGNILQIAPILKQKFLSRGDNHYSSNATSGGVINSGTNSNTSDSAALKKKRFN